MLCCAACCTAWSGATSQMRLHIVECQKGGSSFSSLNYGHVQHMHYTHAARDIQVRVAPILIRLWHVSHAHKHTHASIGSLTCTLLHPQSFLGMSTSIYASVYWALFTVNSAAAASAQSAAPLPAPHKVKSAPLGGLPSKQCPGQPKAGGGQRRVR